MYTYTTGRGRKRKTRLVRLSQYDGYMGSGWRISQSRRAARRRARSVLALILLLTCAGIFSGVRLVAAGSETQENVVVKSVQMASGNTEDQRGDSGVGEIVLLSEQEPKVPLVIIDPGHGGDDNGCSRGDVLEKDVNLQLSLALAAKLHDMGIDAVLTRENDWTQLSLEERVAIAEGMNADLFVSIHQNACEEKESSVEGVETWYCDENPNNRRLAQLVNMGAVDKTGAKERELVESDELYVLRETSMPSCLIETSFLSNKTERTSIIDPDYQDKMAEGIAEGIQLYFYPKTMYLTFDDGPSEENTTAVLDILKENGIKATFFVVGENVRKHPEIARRIVEEGHTIGIHCNHHDYDTLYESVDSYLVDFEEAYRAVYEVTGVEVQFFRFPGGSINAYNEDVYEEIIDRMTERGFIYFDWNGSLDDATANNSPEQLIENARSSTLGRKKVVMLAHDIVYNTTLCLDKLIDEFPDYRMEPLTSEVSPIQF